MGSCKLPIDCSWLETLLLPVHFCGSELFPTSCGFKNADVFCRREKAFRGKPKGKLFWLAQLCLHSNACSCLSQNAEQGSGSELRRNVTVSLPDHETGAPPLSSTFPPVILSENALKVSEAAAWGVGARGGGWRRCSSWAVPEWQAFHAADGNVATILDALRDGHHMPFMPSCWLDPFLLALQDHCLNGEN